MTLRSFDTPIILIEARTYLHTLSLHDALPISFAVAEFFHEAGGGVAEVERNRQVAALFHICQGGEIGIARGTIFRSSEEHRSELQSFMHLVCRLLLETKVTFPRGNMSSIFAFS